MICRKRPKLKDLLNDGIHNISWLWGFNNRIPIEAQEDLTEYYEYYEICCSDPEEFHNYFRRNIKKLQGRFINLLTAESYEIDPMVTNYVKEITLSDNSGKHDGTETSATMQNENQNSKTENTKDYTEAGNNITKNNSTDKTKDETTNVLSKNDLSKETTDEVTNETKTNNGKEKTEEGTTKAKEEKSNDYENTTAAENTEEGNNKRTTPGVTETKTHSPRGSETETKSYGTVTETESGRETTTKTEAGSERDEHGVSQGYEKTSTNRKSGETITSTGNGEIVTDMPEVDTSAEIAAIQAAANGTISQPAMTYANSGKFSGETTKTGYNNYSDETTETQNGSSYDERTFNQRTTTNDRVPDITKTTRHGSPGGQDADDTITKTFSNNREDIDITTREGYDTERQDRSEDKTSVGSKEGKHNANATEAESKISEGTKTEKDEISGIKASGSYKENNSNEASGSESKGESTQTGSSENTNNKAGFENGVNLSSGSTVRDEATTKRTEQKETEERKAFHIVQGRNGYSPQELLQRYQDFVINSKAFEWLCDEMKICFSIEEVRF